MTTHITNINNSLTMITMRVTWHQFYIGLVCQNCFAHSLLILMTLFMVLSNFVKGTIRWIWYTRLLNYILFYIFWSTTYNCLSKQILTLNLTDSIIINIILIIHTVLVIKSKHCNWNILKLCTEVIVCRFSSE